MTKFFILMTMLLVSFASYAHSVCKFTNTASFYKAVHSNQIKQIKKSTHHGSFSSFEQRMIFKAITSDPNSSMTTLSQALREFGDFGTGSDWPGPNAGEIEYFEVKHHQFALVHYWPGENEYGAFFEINQNKNLKIAAEIRDGDIFCHE